MVLIDDQGRLFGLVNVIDALVVLAVAAVVVGGIAFVFSPDAASTPEPDPEDVTLKAVLDLGTKPGYVAEALQSGDSFSPDGSSAITVTDVYVAPERERALGDVYVAPDRDRVRVLLGVRLRGVESDHGVTYDGSPIRVGREIVVQTDDYRVSGRLRDIGRGLEREEVDVVLNLTVSPETAEMVDVGDEYTLAGRDVATIESVSAFATGVPGRRLLVVGLSVHAIVTDGGPRFGRPTIAEGDKLTFTTEQYEIAGTVYRVGASEVPGTPATRRVVLEIEDVRPGIADDIRPGATETVLGRSIAEVVEVRSEPADTRIITRGGNLTLGPHPENLDLTVTADLSVRETDSRVLFKGRTIKAGSVVYLGLENATVRATVVEL